MDQVTYSGPLGTVKFDPATHESTTPVLVFQTVGDSTAATKLKLLKWSLVNPQSGPDLQVRDRSRIVGREDWGA